MSKMKKRILLTFVMAFMLICLCAISVNAACEEHTDCWTVTLGSNGYLGELSAVNVCSVCETTVATEKIPPMFETLGYSCSDQGITQHYAVNREALARYESITGEKVRFGAVTATRNNVSGNPLDENGNALNPQKVKTVDFTDTEYDVYDVIVNQIPEEYRGTTEIICCAYIIAGGTVTYIDNGIEKNNAAANTHSAVVDKIEKGDTELPVLNTVKIIGGARYKVLSLEDLALSKWSFWQSDVQNATTLNTGTDTTSKKFFATRRFTKDELPNGTMIVVESGWQYRPEGWINDSKNNSENASINPRPKTTSESVIVDDAWWGSFTTRAFNITNGTAYSSSATASDVYKIFAIYVPVGEQGENVVIPPISEPESVFDPTADKQKQNWLADGALKILCIGNSFSVDSMEYVYQIASNAGVENIVLGNLYIGGCSLATHLQNATNDSASYTYYTNTSGSWSSTGGYKISTAVKSDDWDFITFQQVSGYSGIADSYDDLSALIEIVEPLNPSARLAWHMTWAYQSGAGHSDFSKYDKDQMTMYNAIVNAVKTKILTNEKIEIVIPAGTSIQNARTSYVGDTLTHDGYHLTNDLGRFIGGLSYVRALTGLSIDNLTYMPSGVDEKELLMAIEAVNNALLKPYEVTNSTYTEADEDVDVPDVPSTDDGVDVPEGYRQLTLEEMGWQESSFWNRQSFSHNSNDSFHNGYYGTTQTFTVEDIPVGSIIILKQGENWQYRPEGWGGSGSRPGNVTTEKVVVDDAWWNGYTTRAFNISKTTSSAINTYTPEEIYNVLVILVPVADDEGGTEEIVIPEDSIVTQDQLVKSEYCSDEITEIDGKEYRALTIEGMGLVATSYYWSEKSTELWKDDEGTAQKYFATGVFERYELVDGAVIWVADGWQYRPEGWVDGNLNSADSRPANTASQTTVDSTWWGSFTTRAFNISMLDSSVLADKGYETTEQVYEVFKIYIPVDKIAAE